MDRNKVIFRFVKIAFSIMLALVLLYGTIHFATKVYDFGYRLFTEAPVDEEPGQNVKVTIEEGLSTKEVCQLLEDKGLIRDANLFFFQLKLAEKDDRLAHGNYILNTSMNFEELIEAITTTDKD